MPGDPDDGAYLESMLRLLWPPPAVVSVTDRRAARGDGTGYVVIPSRQRPRLVVPRRPRRAAAGAMRNFKTAASGSEQLKINALALGLRAGAHDWLPDHVVITPDPNHGSGIDAYLRTVLGRRVHLCLYVGPARAVRKPVLQLLDDHGDTIAFAKLGVDEFTSGLVRDEAAGVARVAAAAPMTVRVPDVLHYGTWNDQALLVQSALPRGRPASTSSTLVASAVREIAGVGGLVSNTLVTSTYWSRLNEQVHGLEPGPIAVRLTRALDEIAAAHSATTMEFGCSHGDFAPWNMTVVGERLAVWDWEKIEDDVPLAVDAVHCDVQGEVVIGGVSPAAAFAITRDRVDALLAPIGNASAATLVVWLYAVDIATRYLLDREQEAGHTRMTDLAAWLPQVLDDFAATAGS